MLSRPTKTRAYLEVLFDRGPLTDHEAYEQLRARLVIAFTSIQSIRNHVMDCSLVRKLSETRPSPFGLPCHLYELTPAGRAAVEAFRKAA